MHLQIQEMEVKPEIKEFLLKYAGPTLEEIEKLLHPKKTSTHNDAPKTMC